MAPRLRTWIPIALWLLAACASEPPADGGGGNGGPGDNRPPHIDPVGPQVISEGETLELTFIVSDPDGDTLYLEAVPLPEGAEFDPVQGTLVYTPDFDVVSSAEGALVLPDITVTVDDRLDPSDPEWQQATATVSISVAHSNQLPLFLASDGGRLTDLQAQVDPATEERIDFQVIDSDADVLTLQLSGSPAYVRLEETDSEATLIVSPTEADRGSLAEFDIVANDGTATATLPVRVVVGNLEAELPAPTGLFQDGPEGDIPVGGTGFEGSFTFGAAAHDFEYGPLRLQVEVALLEQPYEEGRRAIGEPTEAGAEPFVLLTLAGDAEFRWRARYLSDEFGGGPTAMFGGNAETDPDLVVSIVPDTGIDEPLPHDPSPPDVTFSYFSPNVSDFECKIDEENWAACNTRVTCPNDTACAGDDCTCAQQTYIGLGIGGHTFMVRGVTREGEPDPTPESHEWDVLDLDEPETFLTTTPPAPVGCAADFQFVSDDTSATFECRLDRTAPIGREFQGDFLACASPKTYSGLETGSYTFHVRAVNLVGEPDQTPQTHSFSTACEDE